MQPQSTPTLLWQGTVITLPAYSWSTVQVLMLLAVQMADWLADAPHVLKKSSEMEVKVSPLCTTSGMELLPLLRVVAATEGDLMHTF